MSNCDIPALDAYELATIMFPLIHDQMRVAWEVLEKEESEKGNTIIRKRRPVESIIQELGCYAPRYYRMSVKAFWNLHGLLKTSIDFMDFKHHRNVHAKKRIGPNGLIHSSLRLSIALRYFAGGESLDIALVHGVSHSSVFDSVWMVVDAVNQFFTLKYPENHKEQEAIAEGFKKRSQAAFATCAGAIDCMLVWTHKPSDACCEETRVQVKKFYCGHKKKFGLVLQCICDAKRRFLDVSIGQAGSTSDYLTFITSSIYYKLENPGFLSNGLALFGDCAYISNPYMVTPFKQATSGHKDAFNYLQSQLRINIECAFGMLTKRFGILRRAMPLGITVKKTSALTMALCKLHNYCIDSKESIPSVSAQDSCSLSLCGQAPFGDEKYENNLRAQRLPVQRSDNIPTQLIGGGHHFQDIDLSTRRQNERSTSQRYGTIMEDPRTLLYVSVVEKDLSRPKPKHWK